MSSDLPNVTQQPPVQNASHQTGQETDTLSPEALKKFFDIFFGKSGEVEGGEPIDQTNALKELLGDKFAQAFDSLNISDPDLPKKTDEMQLQFAMEYIVDNDMFKGSYKFADLADFSMALNLDIKGAQGSGTVTATALDNKPPAEKIAFLGGLVMVSLSEVLANYAKEQSGIEKMMSEFWIKTEELLKDLAGSIAANIREKAMDQMISNILQAGLTAVGIGITIAGAAKALDTLSKGMNTANAAAVANIQNAMFQAIGQLFSQVATKGVEGSFAYQIGMLEATNKILENIEQQFQKLVDKYSQEGNEASKKVADALEMIRNLWSAITQAFKGLGGGH